jgi:hypothetical protein
MAIQERTLPEVLNEIKRLILVKEEFDKAFDTNKREDGNCFAFVIAEYLGIAERTVRDRVIEFSDEYVTKKGIISHKK